MPRRKRSPLFSLLPLLFILWITIPTIKAQDDLPNGGRVSEGKRDSSKEVQAPSSKSPQTAEQRPAQVEVSQTLTLVKATMCERVENLNPVNPATVFSASVGQVSAYTFFDPVLQPTLIHHHWYHRDALSNPRRLRLYPPKWGTYSVMQLRETDKGPWRVEITDQDGKILETLRFSITD